MAEHLLESEAAATGTSKPFSTILFQTMAAGAFSGLGAGAAIAVVLSVLTGRTELDAILDNVWKPAGMFALFGGAMGLLIGVAAWCLDRLRNRTRR